MTFQSRIVSKVVRSSLEKDTLSVIAVINKIVSPRKIARRLLPEVEKELGFKPKLESVSKVVERYLKDIEESGKFSNFDVQSLKEVFSKTQVTIRSDVALISLKITRGVGKRLVRIMEHVYSRGVDPFLTITYGKSHITLLFDQLFFDKIVKIVGNKNIVYSKKNHAALSIINPPDVLNVPGFAGHVFSILGLNGINIVEMLSSYNEGIMIVSEKDANKGYAVLRNEIERIRKQLR